MGDLVIPGHGSYSIEHLVLDYNGTLALDGTLLPGVAERIKALANTLTVHVLTADTVGSAQRALATLPCVISIIACSGEEDKAKCLYLERLGAERCVAIGNGLNDRLMVARAAIGICVIQEEGVAGETLRNADIICRSILDALDLLLVPSRLIATTRGCHFARTED